MESDAVILGSKSFEHWKRLNLAWFLSMRPEPERPESSVSDYASSAACISPTFMRSGLFTVKPRMDGSSFWPFFFPFLLEAAVLVVNVLGALAAELE
jgi:hypothetical protein